MPDSNAAEFEGCEHGIKRKIDAKKIASQK
jgi:hypothetical protein